MGLSRKIAIADMNRTGRLGLCLVAASAMLALWAMSASAASPEYKACVKVPNGAEFTENGCVTPAAGNGGKGYKLEPVKPGSKITGTGTNTVTTLIKPDTKKAEEATTCQTEQSISTIVGPKETTLTVVYEKCSFAGKPCETPRAKGKVKTEPLKSELVALANGKVGIKFTPEAGAVLAEYNCEGIPIITEGAVIGQIEGLSGRASQTWSVKLQEREGTPGNFQEFLYRGGEGNAVEEEEAQDHYEFVECLEKGRSKAECEVAVGDGAEPAAPEAGLWVTNVVEPPLHVMAPFAQKSTTSYQGPQLKIV